MNVKVWLSLIFHGFWIFLISLINLIIFLKVIILKINQRKTQNIIRDFVFNEFLIIFFGNVLINLHFSIISMSNF